MLEAPLLPFQCLRLTAKILLRRLPCQEDLSFKKFGPLSPGTIGGPWEEGGPSQAPLPLQTPPPSSPPSNTSLPPPPPPKTNVGISAGKSSNRREEYRKGVIRLAEAGTRVELVITNRTVKAPYIGMMDRRRWQP